uniref:ABC transporter ATP-binding protein n=1 Tax=Immundisolibacter sp. TaxID=1934948 RepID=UPI003566BA32
VVFFTGRLRARSRTAQGWMGDVGAYLQETFLNIRMVQAYGNEALHRDRMRSRVAETFLALKRSMRSRALMIGSLLLAVYSSLGIIIWLGGRGLAQGTITAGELSSFVFYAVIVASAVSSAAEVLGQISQGAGAADRIFELRTARPTRTMPESPVPLPVPGLGEVEFAEVTFHYPASEPTAAALDDVSFRVGRGEQVALVGPSGAGKSTIFGLLLGFFEPHRGRVLLDGVDIAQADLGEVRRRFGIVPQDAVMFSGTIADNIRYGRLDASPEAIEKAADAAHIGRFVRSLPRGFDTEVGERGVRLSGGQKQRIAIARAILRDPPIMLLDEATSALDAESERAVQLALEELSQHRTVIVIAHRLATVINADRIIVMDQGRIIGTGTHAQLVQSNELYARLSALQFSTSAPAAGV